MCGAAGSLVFDLLFVAFFSSLAKSTHEVKSFPEIKVLIQWYLVSLHSRTDDFWEMKAGDFSNSRG